MDFKIGSHRGDFSLPRSLTGAKINCKLLGIILVIFILLFLFPSHDLRAEEGNKIDWDALGEEGVQNLSRYLQIDTTNPPGNEMKTALFLEQLFKKEGIECKIIPLGNGRANLYARLRGKQNTEGKKREDLPRFKALILTNHMDVVYADKESWQVPPFSGEIKDGYVWGRGALDMKDMAMVQMMAMFAIKRSGILSERDIIFVALADEEEGSMGAKHFIENSRHLISDAGYLLNEGECIHVADGKVLNYGVAVTEKAPLWLRISAMGESGHASEPHDDDVMHRLTRAGNRLLEWNSPYRIIPVVRESLKRQALMEKEPYRSLLLDIDNSIQDPAKMKILLSRPGILPLLKNTVALTVFQGGEKVNVIPEKGFLEIDCRLLPDEDPDSILDELKKQMNDPTLEITVMEKFKSASSPVDSILFKAIEKTAQIHHPGVAVIPEVLVSSTDSHYFRRLGIVSYGFEPFCLSAGDQDGCHGINERISTQNIHMGIRLLVEIIREMDRLETENHL